MAFRLSNNIIKTVSTRCERFSREFPSVVRAENAPAPRHVRACTAWRVNRIVNCHLPAGYCDVPVCYTRIVKTATETHCRGDQGPPSSRSTVAERPQSVIVYIFEIKLRAQCHRGRVLDVPTRCSPRYVSHRFGGG